MEGRQVVAPPGAAGLCELVAGILRERGRNPRRVKVAEAERIARTIVLHRVDECAVAWWQAAGRTEAWPDFCRTWRRLHKKED